MVDHPNPRTAAPRSEADDRDEAKPVAPRVRPTLSDAAKQEIPGATGGQGAAGAGGPKGFGTGT